MDTPTKTFLERRCAQVRSRIRAPAIPRGPRSAMRGGPSGSGMGCCRNAADGSARGWQREALTAYQGLEESALGVFFDLLNQGSSSGSAGVGWAGAEAYRVETSPSQTDSGTERV